MDPTFMKRAEQLHTNLLLGKAGGGIVASMDLVLFVLGVSGVALWWRYKRTAIKLEVWGSSPVLRIALPHEADQLIGISPEPVIVIDRNPHFTRAAFFPSYRRGISP
jgi:hypothetical protein